ncbi:hypothetical protein CLTEP_11660 [Clostridium tepidiprofundi DSM 19306]|uniref:DUF3006 domain-containing protein n=1 Tax=Clostridium tepidiprofundi DSM 19306 TaxID=1121338 RepID=A0A151B4K6_9CLOT|nr:DUF3006 domain-containing protein [Clostridium tepidiprofundi]KYH34851.1 hypothetical protein CLTEP_11660 [Clostridium tepidiprofundi DSM 19306]
MKGIIDRFEGQFAIVELDDGEIVNVPKIRMPSDAEEGMVIDIDETITINYKETEIRKTENDSLAKELWED